jgi:alpha-glucosidase
MEMGDSEFEATQWWQTGVIYQVYPRSFQDTDGDGVGDLRGITARLDYLQGLGVDAVWISPFYRSPMADFGYDVSDYTGVDPLFGTMEDFDALLAAAHARGLRVILDFVPNHTSDQHPWFVESRSSRTNAKRDWYLWHDAAAAGDDWRPARERVPNNWMSQFGGPAWTWDEGTGQFYLHSFLKEQPDLNWRNLEVRAAMYAAMRFWLDRGPNGRGVDGFRMDVMWLLIKDEFFRDNPPNATYSDGTRVMQMHNADQPETLEIVAEMRALMEGCGDSLEGSSPVEKQILRFAKDDNSKKDDKQKSEGVGGGSSRVLIGEIYLPLPKLVRYYGAWPQLSGADLPFNFHLIQTRWAADAIADVIRTYEGLLPAGAWPNYVLGNHDQSRLASRIGAQQARAAAMLLLTLRGTPTMYYGDELGMVDVAISAEQVRDPAEKNHPGKGRGRDPERSPMIWVGAANAGFTQPDAVPWLPLMNGWETENAAEQAKRPASMLMLYRKLLALRRQHDTLHAGGIADVAAEGAVLRYRRVGIEGGESTDFMVLLNLGAEVATVKCGKGTVVLTTLLDGEGSEVEGTVTLEAGEGLLIALE